MSGQGVRHRWEVAAASSRVLIDVAAGRPIDRDRPLTDEELVSASRHGLLGVMALSDNPLLADPTRAAFSRLAARQQAMEGVLRSVLAMLWEASIPATVVKGPALARWAYVVPGHRTYTDLDLLVPADRIGDVLELLAADEQTIAIPPKTPKADKRNIAMIAPSGVRFTLDLHWDLFSYSQLRGCAAGAVDEGWRAAVPDPDHALGPMWRLPEPLLMAFLATHALLDHRFRLILFRDLVEVGRRPEVDWDAYVDLSRRHLLRSTGYLSWWIASRLVQAPVPEEVLAELRPKTLPVRAAEVLLPRVDPVTFDGHRPHPLNLAVVLQHDRRSIRLRLGAAAPAAYPEWLRRVAPSPPLLSQGAAAKAPPRVLHLLPVDIARGAQTYARAMRDTLDGEAAEHRTATIFRSDPISLAADFDLAARQGRGRNLGFSIRAFLKLRSFLRRWEPEIVVAHGGESLKYAALAVRRPVRLIHHKIGTSEPELGDSPVRRRLHTLLTERADIVVAVSQEMALESQTLLGVPPARIRHIPNGRDPEMFTAGVRRHREEPLHLVSVGYVTRAKRPEWFVEAVEAVRFGGIEARGTWVGDGPELERIRRMSRGVVEFTGRRNDVPDILASADVFLLSSTAEGMPGVLIEAGLSGLPSVTTRVSGASAVVEDGITGFVLELDDLTGFLEAVLRLARDPDLRHKMGEEARRRCLEHFTLQASLDLWRRVIIDLLGEPRR